MPVDSVRLNEVFDNAIGMETDSLWLKPRWHEEIASVVAPQPVQSTTLNSQLMSMDDVLKSVDAWMVERQVLESNDSPGATSSWPQRNGDVEWDVVQHQVKFPRHEQRNEDLGSVNPYLADWQSQTPLAMGVWHNGAHNIAPQHEITSRRYISQELACRAAVAEPETQTPGVTVNGVSLRLPQCKLLAADQSATASGSCPQKVLPKVSAGTSLVTARKMAYIICCGT